MALFRTELRKATGRNPWFWGSLAAGSFLALYSALDCSVVFTNTLEQALKYWGEANKMYSTLSCFAFWMPVKPYELGPGTFLLLWPLLAAIPYSWSWCSEARGGFVAQQAARASRRECYLAKTGATFIVGALGVSVPLLVSLVACACFAPAGPVWVSDILYVGVTDYAPLSSLFYTCPLAFCALWTLISGLVGGLWAAAVAAVAALAGRFAETAVATYLLLHVLSYTGSQLTRILPNAFENGATPLPLCALNVFSVVSVRNEPGAGTALPLVVVSLAALLAILLAVHERRDVL